MSIENKTADTILQKPIELKVGGNVYYVAKPTLATLIEVSKSISLLPKVGKIHNEEVIPFILSNASKYGRVLAHIAAILIVGIGNDKKAPENKNKWKIRWFQKKKRQSKIDVMTEEIMNNASCKEISEIISGALSYQGIGFFLSTIISLSGANVTEKTKNETEATALGE